MASHLRNCFPTYVYAVLRFQLFCTCLYSGTISYPKQFATHLFFNLFLCACLHLVVLLHKLTMFSTYLIYIRACLSTNAYEFLCVVLFMYNLFYFLFAFTCISMNFLFFYVSVCIYIQMFLKQLFVSLRFYLIRFSAHLHSYICYCTFLYAFLHFFTIIILTFREHFYNHSFFLS